MKDLNRRSFIKNSALFAGGSAIIANPLMSSAFYAGADEIKVALIGCGGRGSGAAFQALSVKENVRLVAMADA
jgi:myo-inositol 2-dehydrogenase/D-chiro-inositol 1-dehydrogenase